MKRIALLATVLLRLANLSFGSSGELWLMRHPALSKTQIVFAYAGDLWIVSREGGDAVRLTAGPGNEALPCFSPDGKRVAFSGEYDGNIDVYTIPVTGGVPKRLTYHPGADNVAGWTADGKQVLFVSQRNSYSTRFARLFTMALDSAFPSEVPLPMGYEGAYSPDGKRLAYTPIPRAFSAWKRYRGGRTSAIWIADLSDSSVQPIPRDNSNDFCPMWVGEKIFFLSDRNGPVTLFSYDTRSRKVQQAFGHNGLDIKSAAAGPDAIVYEQFGSVHLFDWKSGKSKPVPIRIQADLLGVRKRFEKVSSRITNAAISPTGARAVFEARGDILTVPAEKGDVRNLTRTSGVAERDPSWSPDGKWIAYFSDGSGEYALHLRDQKGLGDSRKIALGNPPSFFYLPTWSPDSKKIAYTDKRLHLWYVDIEKGEPVKVDTFFRNTDLHASWSPDSRWLAYSKPLRSWYGAVFVYSLEDRKATQITDGLGDAGNVVFDASGKYLYFTASTDIGPRVFRFDMSSYPHRPTRSVYLCVLKKDLPSPLAPESDEEKLAGEKKEEKSNEKTDEEAAASKNGGKAEEGKKASDATGKTGDRKTPPKVEIDFELIGQRILALPVPARDYTGLAAGKPNALFLVEQSNEAPAEGTAGPAGATVHKFDLEKRKTERVLDGVLAFELSANGEKMLYRKGQNWFITSASQSAKPGDGKLKTDDMEVLVDPREEWAQMYREAWRIERDFFYDPHHHGLDLDATAKKYSPFVDALMHRADLNYLFQEMLGELSVGHLYVAGGDVPDPRRVPGGLLGADYKVENGRYRFAKVYTGENWNPQLRAPLTQPGVNVVAGEYLLEVNGRNLAAADNVYEFFEATAGKQVVLRIGPNPETTGSREVTVVPVADDIPLRNLAWVEENRRQVDRASGGKLAYVYLPDTARRGYTFFNRYFFSQTDKEGVVVDERFNSGGHSADYIIDYLRKPLMSHWAVRDGEDFRAPFGTIPGPKAMLMNQYSGSGGDLLPWMFRRAGLGPLIGKRTWGGLVGIGGYPTLIDGGSVTAPNFAFYSPEGKWEVENHGVDPDIDIEFDPKAWRKGRDVQLERAVAWLEQELKKKPNKKPERPPYPNYHSREMTKSKPPAERAQVKAAP